MHVISVHVLMYEYKVRIANFLPDKKKYVIIASPVISPAPPANAIIEMQVHKGATLSISARC